eukprot:TRINITY_DN16482_c0_g1_i1.p1 TRINITY_DN16482_c0_g1~~TRINITY_DN16482_c0_g1_i1.p1  ORF type:complete len:731 (+),score=168.43 TRINITY_DN16482_c0_g1_i1:169-2361(+)
MPPSTLREHIGPSDYDATPYSGVDTIRVSVDADVKTNKQLYQAVVEATGQMLGEISQQLVEFDNERKQADIESGRRLQSATEPIAKRLHMVEKEILEGQRYMEVMESMNQLTQLVREPNHEAVLHAIGRMKPDSDFMPLMRELDLSMQAKHGKLEELLVGIHENHASLHGKHAKLQELVLGLQAGHASLFDKHSAMLGNHTKLQELLADLRDAHHTRHGEVLGHQGKLRDMLLSLQDRHGELLNGLAAMSPPDMRRFDDHFSSLGDFMDDHGTRLGSLDQRLSNIEKCGQEQRRALEMLLQRLPPDLDKTMRALSGELQAARRDTRQEISALQQDLAELRAMRKESAQSRADAATDTAALKKELHKVHAALECIPEVHQRLSNVHDKISAANLHYDDSDVLRAISKIKPLGLDHDSLATALHEKLARSTLRVDNSELLRHLGKLDLDKHFDNHHAIIDGKLKKHTQDIAKALSTLPSHEHLGSLATDIERRLRGAPLTVDHSELKQMLNRLPTPTAPDHQAIADAVHERIGGALLNAGNHGRILEAIGSIHDVHHHNHGRLVDEIARIKDPDLTVLLEAIEAMEEAVLTNTLEAIQNINMVFTCKNQGNPLERRESLGSARVRQRYSAPEIRPRPSASSPSTASFSVYEPEAASDFKETYRPRPRQEKVSPRRAESPYNTIWEQSDSTSNGAGAATMACACGYTCGTPSALERHLTKMMGQRGHRPVATS